MKFSYIRKPKRKVLYVAEGIGNGKPTTLPQVYGRDSLPEADTTIKANLEIPDLRVYEYQDVALLPRHVILDGTLQYVYPSSFKKHRHHRHMGLKNLGGDEFAPAQTGTMEQVTLLPGTSYYLDCEFPNIYGHFLIEVWTQLWALKYVNDRDIRFVTSIELPKYVLDVLGFLGVPENRIDKIDGLTRCETLIVPGPSVVARRYVHPVAREMFDKISQMAFRITPEEEKQIEVLGEKVYFSRSGIAGRGLVNEAQVERLVEAHGYDVVHLEKYSMAAQMAILAKAKKIVGPGGSGMHNAVFANRPDVLILASEGWFTVADILLSQNKYNLSYVFGNRLSTPKVGSRGQEPWRIDLALVQQALEKFDS